MKKIIQFTKSARNIYFSFIALLTIVTALMSITFSFYIDESANITKIVSLSDTNVTLESNELTEGKITLSPYETRILVITIKNQEPSLVDYILHYKQDNQSVTVQAIEGLTKSLNANETKTIQLILTNLQDTEANVQIDVASNYVNNPINYDGIAIHT